MLTRLKDGALTKTLWTLNVIRNHLAVLTTSSPTVIMMLALTQTVLADETLEKFQASNLTASKVQAGTQWPGETISPLDRELQWTTIDVEIPGNGPTISVGRSYVSYSSPSYRGQYQLFGKWGISIPQIDVGIWSSLTSVLAGCGTIPATKSVSVRFPNTGGFREIAQNPSQISYPSGTHMHFENNWLLNCESFTTRSSSTDSGGSPMATTRNDGLTLVAPDGTKYRFSYWSQETITTPIGPGRTRPVYKVYTYYVSDIEDMWGNWVAFDYQEVTDNSDGESDYNLKLTQIRSSDSRTVSVAYNANDRISTLTYGGRTISYAYESTEPTFLKTVTYPENVQWQYTYYPNVAGQDWKETELHTATAPQGATITYEYTDWVDITGCNFKSDSVNNWVSKRTVQNGSQQYVYTYSTATASVPGYTWGAQTTVVGPEAKEIYQHGCIPSSTADKRLIKHLTYGGAGLATLMRQRQNSWTYVPYTGTYHNSFSWASQTPNRAILSQVTTDTQYIRQFSNFDGYGTAGTLTEQGDSASRTWSITYYNNPTSWVIGVPDNETVGSDLAITRNHNSFGQITSETKNGVTTQLAYTGRHLTSLTNGRGHTTTYASFYRGTPQTITYPIHSESRVVDQFGNITSETNERGKTTSYTFDGIDRITLINRPIGSDPTITYTGNSTVTVKTGNFEEMYTLDSLNRATLRRYKDLSTGETRYRNYSFDSEGRTTFASIPSTSSTEIRGATYAYDALGRKTQKTTPAGTTTFSYLAGNKISETNPRSFTTTRTYRSYGHPDERILLRIDQPSSSGTISTVLTKDTMGKLLSISQGGKSISYTYDSTYDEYLAQEAHPGFTIYYGRDAHGNMTSRRVGNGPTTVFTYDSRDRLTNINYPPGLNDTTYTYGGNGVILSATNVNSTWQFSYDDNDNVLTRNLSVGSQQFNFSYAYDGRDHTSSITYPDSTVVSFSPNAFGESTRAGSFVTSATYHPTGNIKSFTYGSGLTYSSTLDSTGARFQEMKTKNGGTDVVKKTYSYDAQNNITAISDGVTSGRSISSITYDGADRLTGATSSAWGGGISIAYDALGNITQQTLPCGSVTYAYNSNNFLTSTSGCIARTFGTNFHGAIVNNGQNTFTYDHAERLAIVGGGGVNKTFEYDAFGRRVKITSSGATEYEVHDADDQLLWVRESSGTTRKKVYLGDKLVAQRRASTTTYMHFDALGSSVAVSTSPSSIQHEHYEPYGKKVLNPAGTNVDQWYTAKRFDPAVGLSYYGARYYDPAIGRFYSADPEGFSETAPMLFNRYSYANNNPYKYNDPDGELPVFVVPALIWLAKEVAATAVEETTGIPVSTKGIVKAGAKRVAKAAAKRNSKEAKKPSAAPGKKTYQTYTKPHPKTGEVYSGQTSGTGTPLQNIARRESGHHKNKDGFGPAKLDKSSDNPDAIRGREQILIERHGGAKSMGGTSGNSINGVSPKNKKGPSYREAALREFGDD